jgi:hypothetical protein
VVTQNAASATTVPLLISIGYALLDNLAQQGPCPGRIAE